MDRFVKAFKEIFPKKASATTGTLTDANEFRSKPYWLTVPLAATVSA
jgi:hypothetical protein